MTLIKFKIQIKVNYLRRYKEYEQKTNDKEQNIYIFNDSKYISCIIVDSKWVEWL